MMDTEHNLLFGVLAVRADLITAGQLADAWDAWHLHKDPLRDILRRWGWITPADEARVDSLYRHYLDTHSGNLSASLRAAVEQKVFVTLRATRDPKAQRLLGDLLAQPGSLTDPATTATVRYAAEIRDRYTLVQLHATGGIGVIWLAFDSDLGRTVALKELRPETVRDLRASHRFLTEAKVTGQLEHPGIVPVYELGRRTLDQKPFYTMRFVKGRTLTEAIRAYHQKREARRAGTVERNELLTNFIALCKTLAYAHSRGVIHRDLKGQNVLLGDFGEVIVLDWGLAKVVERIKGADAAPVVVDDDGVFMTVPGQAIGTPAFMSPEQAAGRLDLIDHRADIYGLGAILYEILTGRPPFVGRDVQEVLRKVRHEQPVPPRQLCPEVPAPLQAVCLRALAKDLTQRYASAGDLAQDVQRCLADEPVQAYPESWRQRVGRWSRRHQAWVRAAALAAVLMALVSFAAVILLSAAQHQTNVALTSLRQEQERTAEALAQKQDALKSLEQEQAKTQQAAAELQRTSYFQGIALSDREWERANIARAQELLDRCPAALRGWEWYHLRRVFEQALKSEKLDLGESQVKSVAWSPDGKLLATAGHFTGGGRLGADGRRVGADQASAVKVWDVANRRIEFTLLGHSGAVQAIAWSPDGRFLATAGADKTVQLWELGKFRDGLARFPVYRGASLASLAIGPFHALPLVYLKPEAPRPRRSLNGHAQMIQALTWSPDTRRLATASVDKTVKVWDVEQGNVVLTFTGHAGGVEAVAWSPSGRHLASAGADKTVKIWDAETGAVIATLDNPDQVVHALAWNADSRTLALAAADKVVLMFVPRNVRLRSLAGHGGPVLAVAWSPDGRYLATAGADKTILIHDAATGARVRALKGHADRVTAVAWTRDSRWLASAGDDNTAQVWDLGQAADPLLLKTRPGRLVFDTVEALAWSPDGKRLAGGSSDGLISIWNPATGERVRSLTGHRAKIHALAWDPDGKRLATASQDGATLVWDVNAAALVHRFDEPTHRVNALAWSPDGQRLATATEQAVTVWDVRTQARLHTLKGRWAVAWSPDGKCLASAGLGEVGGRTAILWDATTGVQLRTFAGHTDLITALCWSPDGKRLATASADRTARVWDSATGAPLLQLEGHTEWVRALSWSRHGDRLATAGETVKIWEGVQGGEVLTLKEDAEGVYSVAWSPEGRRLAAAGIDGTVRVWDAPGYQPR
jgi:WD40 repeat protein/tRNA A-37 threonylcarbamoyl transferase component Bud32